MPGGVVGGRDGQLRPGGVRGDFGGALGGDARSGVSAGDDAWLAHDGWRPVGEPGGRSSGSSGVARFSLLFRSSRRSRTISCSRINRSSACSRTRRRRSIFWASCAGGFLLEIAAATASASAAAASSCFLCSDANCFALSLSACCCLSLSVELPPACAAARLSALWRSMSRWLPRVMERLMRRQISPLNSATAVKERDEAPSR